MAVKNPEIDKAAKKCSINLYGYIEGDYIMPYRDGAKWGIEYCARVLKVVLEHYEPPAVIDCIMADFNEIVSSEND